MAVPSAQLESPMTGTAPPRAITRQVHSRAAPTGAWGRCLPASCMIPAKDGRRSSQARNESACGYSHGNLASEQGRSQQFPPHSRGGDELLERTQLVLLVAGVTEQVVEHDHAAGDQARLG